VGPFDMILLRKRLKLNSLRHFQTTWPCL